MGKFTAFATGMGQGALAAKRYQDTKARADRQDALLETYLGKKSEDKAAEPMDVLGPVAKVIPGNPLSDEQRKELNASDMANGGMVGIQACAEMPNHYDKMGWQRQSFKK